MKVTFPALLFLVFLVLKLTKVIDWSWWLVTAPLYIGVAFAAAIFAVCIPFWVLTHGRKKRK